MTAARFIEQQPGAKHVTVRDAQGEVVAEIEARQRPSTEVDVGAIGNDLRNALQILDHHGRGTARGFEYEADDRDAMRRRIVRALEQIEGPNHVPVPPAAAGSEV
jgi:hypothetical protein